MKPPRQTGFTLVELILVMVVMGLLAGVALPGLMNRQTEDEVRTRDELKATLRLARQVASAQNRPVCFMRTPAQFGLVYANGLGVCNLAGVPVVEPGSGEASGVTPLPNGVLLVGAATLQFDGRGRLAPYVDASITVGAAPTLTINRETGFVY